MICQNEQQQKSAEYGLITRLAYNSIIILFIIIIVFVSRFASWNPINILPSSLAVRCILVGYSLSRRASLLDKENRRLQWSTYPKENKIRRGEASLKLYYLCFVTIDYVYLFASNVAKHFTDNDTYHVVDVLSEELQT